MQYQARAAAVEAERVTLAGQEMAAVAMNGKAHLVPAEVFDLFFALRDAVAGMKAVVKPKAPVTKRTVKQIFEQVKADSERPIAKAAKVNSAEGEQVGAREAILKWLADGPLTTSELADHVYRKQPDRQKRSSAAWFMTKQMAAAGQIERCEHNGIDKWQLKTK